MTDRSNVKLKIGLIALNGLVNLLTRYHLQVWHDKFFKAVQDKLKYFIDSKIDTKNDLLVCVSTQFLD